VAERLKVIFKRVWVLNDADWFGSGEFYFTASVDGRSVGDTSKIFDAVEGTWINLPEATWSAVVDVTGKATVVVKFAGKDQDLFFDDDLGSITYTLRRDYQQNILRHRTKYFILEWEVLLEVAGAFALQPPSTVYACRGAVGNNNCVTVSGASFLARMEFHECRPTPNGVADAPNRPVFPVAAAPAVLNIGGVGALNPADPLNIIPNPSVIPIIAAASVTDQNAARIEFTWYRPGTLAFADDDARLQWTAVGVGGGAVAFHGRQNGTKVMVYGTARGEVILYVWFRGTPIGRYRALVLPVRSITCRFNILNGPSLLNSTPRSTPADIVNHLAITNLWLRPLGVQLQLDTNATRTNGATATATPGIFRIRVATGLTRTVPTMFPPGAVLNHRPNVMNFAYVHSAAGGALGAAIDRASAVGATITDTGTPSTSWISPSGINPDGAAGTVTLNLRPARTRPATPPNLYSMIVSDACGDPTTLAGQQVYANTIAHELGHILHLGHRGVAADGVNDGVNFPLNENMMHPSNAPALAQDFDIIQARAVRLSPLVPV
jgi:hypothetical protein